MNVIICYRGRVYKCKLILLLFRLTLCEQREKKKKEINIVFLSVLRIQHLNVGSFTAVNKKGKAWSQIPIGNINLSAVLM